MVKHKGAVTKHRNVLSQPLYVFHKKDMVTLKNPIPLFFIYASSSRTIIMHRVFMSN